MNISITQFDIDLGTRGSASSCPIALAFERMTGYPCIVRRGCIVFNSGGARVYILPDAANEFVSRYDTGDPVEPFSFTIFFTRR